MTIMLYLVSQSDLFFANQPDEQIDHWFLGADCAGWLYARLLPHPQIKEYCGPVMEDWGWYLEVEVSPVRVELCLYHFSDPGVGDYWILIVSPKNKIFRKHSAASMNRAAGVVRDVLTEIVAQSPLFNRYAWVEQSPFEVSLSKITVDWIESVDRSGE
ncbi:hypothetical protein OT109_11400 [Phycisphaeraceae bacterium D3-23]